MKRRSFLAMLGMLPATAASAAAIKPNKPALPTDKMNIGSYTPTGAYRIGERGPETVISVGTLRSKDGRIVIDCRNGKPTLTLK